MTTTINIPIANGMHPTGTESRASKWFRLFSGLRLTDYGAEPWPTLAQQTLPPPWTALTTWAAVRKDGILMRCMPNSSSAGLIYEGSDTASNVYSASDWDSSHPVDTLTHQRTPLRWHLADLCGAWFLFDGAGGTYFRSGHNGNLWYAQYGQKAGCACRGRLILGGFDSTYAYTYADWKTFFAAYSSALPSGLSGLSVATPGQNWVWWSSAGADDALFWYNKTHLNDTILDILGMNTAGLAVMPWSGTVTRILPTQDGFVVYGTNGATLMKEVESPTPSFGMQRIAGWPDGQGVLAVDGDEYGHLAVATDYTLWFVSGGKAEQVWFQYLYASTAPSVVKDPLFGGFSVGPDVNGEWNYFDKNGCMVRTNFRPSAIYEYNGAFPTGWTATMPAVTPALDIITDTYPITGSGNVAAVKLHGSWATDTYISLMFLRNGTWAETASQLPDSRGIVRFNLPPHQFRVRVHGATTAGVKLERIEVFMGGMDTDSSASIRPVIA